MTQDKEYFRKKNKENWQKNRVRLLEEKKQYYQDNREKFLAKAKIRYENNKERYAAYHIAYYAKKKEEIKAQQRLYNQAHPEKVRARNIKWRENNGGKELTRKYNAAARKRAVKREKSNHEYVKPIRTEPFEPLIDISKFKRGKHDSE